MEDFEIKNFQKALETKPLNKLILDEMYMVSILEDSLNEFENTSMQKMEELKKQQILSEEKIKKILDKNEKFNSMKDVAIFIESLFNYMPENILNKMNLKYYIGWNEKDAFSNYLLAADCYDKKELILDKAKEVYNKEYKDYKNVTGNDFRENLRDGYYFAVSEVYNNRDEFDNATYEKLDLLTQYNLKTGFICDRTCYNHSNSQKDILCINKIGNDGEIIPGEYDLKVNLTKCGKILPEEINKRFNEEITKISNYDKYR